MRLENYSCIITVGSPVSIIKQNGGFMIDYETIASKWE